MDGKIRRQSLETNDYNLAKERLPAEDILGATAAKTAATLRSALLEEANRNDRVLDPVPILRTLSDESFAG